MTREHEDAGDMPAGRAAAHLAERRRGRFRRRRTVAVVVLASFILMVPLMVSYVGALTAPGNTSSGIRTIEWIKGHGGRGIVLTIERWWYEHHQPPIGGTVSTGPLAGAAYSSDPVTGSPIPMKNLPPHTPLPKDIPPIAADPLPREGVWRPVGPTVDGLPTEEVAYMRPDTSHTSLTAGLAWMDTRLLDGVLVGGTQVPGGSWPWGGKVPNSKRPSLAAAFNSGFLPADSNGGFYLDGRYQHELVDGGASMVFYRDGHVSVGAWGRDFTMSSDIVGVRQNIQLIVDNGAPVPELSNDSYELWGATLGNAVMVWRSGVGVDKNGGLIYVSGPGLSITALARLLARAGCVRAMELDINTEWTSFIYYNHYGDSLSPQELLPEMFRSEFRYLTPDDRDFVAMFVRKAVTASPSPSAISPAPAPSP